MSILLWRLSSAWFGASAFTRASALAMLLRVRLQMATSEAACGSANKFGTWQRTANHEQPTRPTRSGSAVGMLDVDAGIEFTPLQRAKFSVASLALIWPGAGDTRVALEPT